MDQEMNGQHEVRYNFDDGSKLTVILDDLANVQMPGKSLKQSDIPYSSVQHFQRKPESIQEEEFQNHLQYAKFINWLNFKPSGGAHFLEVEITE